MTSINLLLANEIKDILPQNVFFATSVNLRGNLRVRLATQRKPLRKFNLRPLATTCRSVSPGLNVTEWLASPGGTKFSKPIKGMSKEQLNVFLKGFYRSARKKDDTLPVYKSSSVE